ncbi:MAG: cytochrome c [Nevskia sp.]|nr:cytochrome c [Nevskia sp.]
MVCHLFSAKGLFRSGVVLAIAATAGAACASAPDADGWGWRLVRKYCSECHEVRPNPASHAGADGAPSFAHLALDPFKGSPAHLRSVLGGPHSSMPPHQFSDGDVDAIVRYFQAVKAVARQPAR